MTEKEYLEKHIPHRVNLLLTYRERFYNLNSEKREKIRDFHRCSKDIAILMVRFFLYEMGVTLKENSLNISQRPTCNYARKLELNDVIVNKYYTDIIKVLKAGNRAVAHLEKLDVNHAIEFDTDDIVLFNGITYVEEKIKTHIYHSQSEYESAMNLPENQMHRERMVL